MAEPERVAENLKADVGGDGMSSNILPLIKEAGQIEGDLGEELVSLSSLSGTLRCIQRLMLSHVSKAREISGAEIDRCNFRLAYSTNRMGKKGRLRTYSANRDMEANI